ncbi:MAG: fasciclin domain-containing protein, partial [Phycisphaerae bacterium]
MKRSLIAVFVLAAGMILGGCDTAEKALWWRKDVVEVVNDQKNLGILHNLIEEADLAEDLKEEGPYTLFAPTNMAFSKLSAGTLEDLEKPENRQQLREVLKYHVVSGELKKEALQTQTLTTLQGGTIDVEVTGGMVKVNGANVTETDLEATNGVVHVID